MTFNTLINNLGMKVVTKTTPLIHSLPTRSGYCVALARIIVENALNVPSHTLYKYVTSGITATHVEHDLFPWRLRSINDRKPGDLLFSPNHVGILLEHDLVLENTTANRGSIILGAIRLTPLARWDKPTSIVRIPQGFRG